jgi:conjugative transfer signal peptidase TraF
MTRFRRVASCSLAVLAIAASTPFHPLPKLIWNASASVPIGLYAVRPARPFHAAELVVVKPPGPLAAFLDERRYLPLGVPLLKRITGLPGQTVCRIDRTITVDGTPTGNALVRDRRGRSLPVWQGCQRIPAGDVFLMNRASKDSFDGRYFGLLPASTVVGRADPIWTRKGV